jgi:cutinase
MISLPSVLLLALAATSAIAGPIEPRQNFAGDTQNGLDGACKGMTVIFARGTTEAGNVGSVAGPPFFQALSTKVGGDLAVQGVDYPADIPGFLAGGDANGSKKM